MAPYNRDTHHRRSIRLQGYDYSQEGAYFLTLCTHHGADLFGTIADGELKLNRAGAALVQCWEEIPVHFPRAELDAFAVMPDHLHGVVFLHGADDVDVAPGANDYSPLRGGTSRTVGSIVRGLKIGASKWFHE